MSSKKIEEFLHYYEVQARVSTHTYYQRSRSRPYEIAWEDRNSPMYAMDYVDRVPYVELLIPQHQLERLVQYQEDSRDYVASTKHAVNMLAQARADERVRHDNPAVAKAYRNYVTLLELARK